MFRRTVEIRRCCRMSRTSFRRASRSAPRQLQLASRYESRPRIAAHSPRRGAAKRSLPDTSPQLVPAHGERQPRHPRARRSRLVSLLRQLAQIREIGRGLRSAPRSGGRDHRPSGQGSCESPDQAHRHQVRRRIPLPLRPIQSPQSAPAWNVWSFASITPFPSRL